MRWRLDKEPKNGDIRYRYVFAWKKTIVGQYVVWLETFVIEEKYYEPTGGNKGWWVETIRSIL